MSLRYYWRVFRGIGSGLLAINCAAIVVLIWNWTSNCVPPALEVISRLAYALIGSTIFYTIVVYLPKEARKQKIARYLNNQIGSIDHRMRTLIVLIRESAGELPDPGYAIPDVETMIRLCTSINPSKITSKHHSVAGSWFDYIGRVGQAIQIDLQTVFHFNDLISKDVLGTLADLDDVLKMHLVMGPYANGDLSAWARPIRDARILSRRACEEFRASSDHYVKRSMLDYRSRGGV